MKSNEQPKAYDYVIVGAGSAGCVLANRLTEDRDVTVLLLEAGETDDHLYLQMPLAWRQIFRGPRFNWNYSTEPEPFADNRRIFLPRGKVLGGSSSINGMLYVRGHPRDYDLWSQLGAKGWGYADVLPYFKKAESNWRGEGEHHGGEGPLGVTAVNTRRLNHDLVLEAARAAGFPVTEDFCGVENEGFGNVDLTVKNGRRASSARVYLHPARSRPNLTVRTGALTQRVVVSEGRATGVDYIHDGEAVTAHARREVIVCGGAYNSPQVLLLSGIGPAEAVAAAGVRPVHDLPGVGRNLQEHPIAYAQFATKGPISFLTRLRLDRVALSAVQWALFKSGDLATQALSGLAFLKSRPDLERPDLQVFCNPVRLDAEIWFPVIKPSQGHMLEGHASLMHPESRGEVTLRSPDPADAPVIRLNMLSTDYDRAAMRAGLRIVRKLYASGPYAELIDHEATPGAEVQSDADLDAHIRSVLEVGHHPVGTCTMGTGAMSVVDPELRVRGLAGLRVVDASVMPTVPGGNTNAPTIMIAEKAADLIKADARRAQPRQPERA